MELVAGLMAFTMAYLCSQMKAVKKPAIKPIVSPVKKVIILFSTFFYIFVGFNIPALLIPFIGNFLEKLNLLTSEEAKKKTKLVKTTPGIGSAGLKGYPGPCPLVN